MRQSGPAKRSTARPGTSGAEAGTEFVQFSPAAELTAVMAALQGAAHSSDHESDGGR